MELVHGSTGFSLQDKEGREYAGIVYLQMAAPTGQDFLLSACISIFETNPPKEHLEASKLHSYRHKHNVYLVQDGRIAMVSRIMYMFFLKESIFFM